MSELVQKQARFTQAVAGLVVMAARIGYLVTFGDAYRSPAQAAANAAAGTGIKNSLHTSRLAMDLNLFDWECNKAPREAYERLGEWWKRQSTSQDNYVWGGDFTQRDDIYHFSFEYNGIR